MLDMRYHVISLVAVFLALGIGILIGTTLVERGLIAEQKAEIKSLKKTFDEIREKNQSLNSELQEYRSYAEQSRPYIVPGRLNGASYVVVTKQNPDSRALENIHQSVASAGGSIPLTIYLAPPETFEDEAARAALSNLFTMTAEPAALRERAMA